MEELLRERRVNRSRRTPLKSARVCVGRMVWLLAFLVPACSHDPAADSHSLAVQFEGLEFQSGDLVFRRGRSTTSRAVLAVDPRPLYSHVGLVWLDASGSRVIHALPPERDGSDEGGLVVDTLEAFLALPATSAAAVYRLRSGSAATGALAAEAGWSYARAGTPFDNGFNLDSDRALYCTELVWSAYLRAGVDLVGDDLDQLPRLLGRGTYILPSTLTRSPLLVELRRAAS